MKKQNRSSITLMPAAPMKDLAFLLASVIYSPSRIELSPIDGPKD
jgi:hypothetical protein